MPGSLEVPFYECNMRTVTETFEVQNKAFKQFMTDDLLKHTEVSLQEMKSYWGDGEAGPHWPNSREFYKLAIGAIQMAESATGAGAHDKSPKGDMIRSFWFLFTRLTGLPMDAQFLIWIDPMRLTIIFDPRQIEDAFILMPGTERLLHYLKDQFSPSVSDQ